MTITIPEKFRSKLEGEYEAYITNMLATYVTIYDDNKVEFFSEYTNHGSQHIEEVLNTAANLISDESYEFLNTKDIFVLVVAVLLHDLGMHITSEGAVKIFSDEYDECRIKFLDSEPWQEIWKEFLYEAKRFNENQLIDIFGTSSIEIGTPDLQNLSNFDRKLFGEFFRRYHPRLAHEIANHGFPTRVGEDNILVHSKIDDEIIDICGLVARSHGMNLRETFAYLKEFHDDSWKNPFDIKVFFLMVVLRISDYIQIHAKRASDILVKTKRFASPVSTQEWIKHSSIKDININTADPERIFVKAKPKNSKIFLELKKLFEDIQYEFDISWAILGEVYGRDKVLSGLKIKFRRITSNIDDIRKFSRTVNYIPERIRFDADPELLKLLIGPLYGEDPKYGVRELLQNSVDAVKERAFVEEKFEQKIKVTVEKKGEDSYYLTIQDNGIGMTKETIVNFFFRAGASFRNSMLWKKNFIEESEVKIEKTGRFGVGVLAAFLLGEEFELFTKHYSADIGYYCKASLSTKQVELLKKDCPKGTFIRVRLNKEITDNFISLMDFFQQRTKSSRPYYHNMDKLCWFNWYVMDSPEITYQIDDEGLAKIFEFKKITVSSKPNQPLKGWHQFSAKDFKSIHWTINKSKRDSYYYEPSSDDNTGSDLFCNGFKVLRGYQMPYFPWNVPTVSVFDGNAKMPLSLSRDYLLNDRLPFETELVHSICGKIIEALHKIEFEKLGNYWIPKDYHLEFLKGKINISEYVVVSNNKYTLMTPFIFESLKIGMLYQLWLVENMKPNILFSNKATFYQAKSRTKDPNYFYKQLLELSYGNSSSRNWFNFGEANRREDIAVNHYILNDKLAYMSEKNRLSKTFRDNYKWKAQLFNDRWVVLKSEDRRESEYTVYKDKDTGRQKRTKKAKEPLTETRIDKKRLTDDYYYFVKEHFINVKGLQGFDDFRKVWEELVGANEFLIPIEKEYRKKIVLGD